MPRASELKLTTPFKISDVGEREASARALIELIASANESIHDRDRRWFLSLAIWRLTEFHRGNSGKFGVRYRSVKAVEARGETKIQHEHVIPRAWLVDQMLARPKRAVKISGLAVACLVTETEHQKLNRLKDRGDLFGWERYRDAEIEVLDSQQERFPDVNSVNLGSLARLQRGEVKKLGLDV